MRKLIAALLFFLTALSPSIAFWHGIAPTTNTFVGNRMEVPTALLTSLASPFTSRRIQYAPTQGYITNIRCVHFGFYIGPTFVLTNPSASYVLKDSLEYSGDITPFTWVAAGGSTSITITPGSWYVSDPLPQIIQPSMQWATRTVHITGAARDVPAMQLPAFPTAIGVGDGSSASDAQMGGTIAPSGSATGFIGCDALLGDIYAASGVARAFVLLGDSLTFGTLDATGSGAKQTTGYLARLIAPTYPTFKVARTSIQAGDFAGSGFTALQAFLNTINYTDFVSAPGRNDLGAGITVNTILTRYQTIYTNWAVGKKLTQITLTPTSTSTDGWITTTNQTPASLAINSLNTSIRAGTAQVNVVLDASDAASSARNSGIFAAPPAMTPDGTHLNSVGAAQVAAGLSIP